MKNTTTTTCRERIDLLPASYDHAIQSALMNAQDMGLDEGDDAFWSEVYGQVMA